MKKLGHKILSIIMSMALVAMFIPSETFNTVFAEQLTDVTTTGLDLSGGSVPLIETTYQAGEGTIVWSPTTTTITGTGENILSGGSIILNNATIDTNNPEGIILPTLFETGTVDISIILKGSNTINVPYGTGITNSTGIGAIPKSLTISQGEDGASLEIRANSTGIFLPCPVIVNSGILSIIAQMHSGITTSGENSDITINGGTVSITANEMNAITAFSSNVTISGGNVTLIGKKSIKASENVTLSGNAKIDTTSNIAIVGDIPTLLSDIFTKDSTITGTVNDVKVELLNEVGDVQRTYDMDGTIFTPEVTIDGEIYHDGGDVSTTELDLYNNTPTETTAYKAGDGYAIWKPTVENDTITSGILTLNNATINVDDYFAIYLPEIPVTIDATGTNKITSADERGCAISCYENLTIQGSGTLKVAGEDVDINCANLTITSGVNVTATGMIYVNDNMIVSTTGTVNAVDIDTISFSHTGTGTINACVYHNWDEDTQVSDLTVYGNATYKDSHTIYDSISIPTGTTLTIPDGETMNFDVAAISASGTIINNGTIQLSATAKDDDVKSFASGLNLTGTGVFLVPSTPEVYYTNSGVKMSVLNTPLDLTNGTEITDQTSFSFTGNSQDGYTLELNNLALNGGITLPCGCPVTIKTNSQSIIEGINFDYTNSGNLTLTGSAPLTIINGISGSGNNGDIITVQGGTNVTISDSINIGASGGTDGTLIVSGTGTTLNVHSNYSTGIYCDTINVQNGATLNVTAESRGINALSGGVSVTGGSTLSAGCDYGVYIIGGKLIVDATSKLITNGAIAPFCIIDNSVKNSNPVKPQADVLSLPGIPTGTQITSAVGTDLGYGYTYWSLVPTEGILGVTNENNEPVVLTGAVTGILNFAKQVVIPTPTPAPTPTPTPDSNSDPDSTPTPTPDSDSTTDPIHTQKTDTTSSSDTDSTSNSTSDSDTNNNTDTEEKKPVVNDIEKNPNTSNSIPFTPFVAVISLITFVYTIVLKKKTTK